MTNTFAGSNCPGLILLRRYDPVAIVLTLRQRGDVKRQNVVDQRCAIRNWQ